MNDKTTTAIAEYSPTAAALAELATRMANVVYDVSTPKGLAAAKADRAEVRDLRVALEKKRVEIKAPALKRCQEIDTEAKRITAELLKYETPPDDAIKAEERRIEAERQKLIEREQQRVADITGRIEDMRGAVNGALRAKTSAEVVRILADVQKVVIDLDHFAESLDAAKVAKSESVAEIERIRDEVVAREAEAEQLRKDREVLDRQRAEQEARDKADREKRDIEQAEAAELGKMRMEEIMSMGYQVMIATGGRLGVREGGTRQCIVETLEETRNWSVTQSKFGPLTEMAMNARTRACEQISAVLVQFDQRVDNERIAAEQRAAQKVIDDQRRELEARQQAERDAQAKREREAAEDLARMERDAEAQRVANYRPSFDEIVAIVAANYGRTPDVVRTWIREAKAERKAA